MRPFHLCVCILASLALIEAAKKPVPGEADNEKVEITASVVPNEQINQSFGYDFQDHFTVIEVRVTPKSGPVEIKLDDFLLRSDRDGDHSTPFPATQIAGDGALVIAHVIGSAGPTGNTTDRGWRLPGGIGRSSKKTTAPAEDENAEKTNKDDQASPKGNNEEDSKVDPELKKKLSSRVLPEKTAAAPVSGLLFFSLEKQKPKDLELIYTTGSGKLHLRFK